MKVKSMFLFEEDKPKPKPKKLESPMKGYDKWEVTSAFHKELRLGRVEEAISWAWKMWDNGKGKWYLQNYLFTVCFEETWSYGLFMFLLKQKFDYNQLLFGDIVDAIQYFCETPKKWEIPEMRNQLRLWRADVYRMFHNQKYKTLSIFDYKRLFAKDWHEEPIVTCSRYSTAFMWLKLCGGFLDEFEKRDESGAFKSAYEFFKRPRENQRYFIYQLQFMWLYIKLGWTWDVSEFTPKEYDVKEIISRKMTIPLYARDKHTRAGKRLMKQDPPAPGKKPTMHDLRYTGDFIGIIWRIQAMEQFGNILVPWEDVEWTESFDYWNERCGV